MTLISEKLESAKKAINELKRKYKFKKANDARAEAADLQLALSTCRGKLEVCKNDFKRTVKKESLHIAEGVKMGADTSIQEQTLWDAAIGFMLVRDAIFSLKTISTFESVTHAYEMLGVAVDMMTDKHRIFSKPTIGISRDRNMYGYLTSNAAMRQKQELLSSFFEELKKTGDIEKCLDSATHPAEIYAERMIGSNGEVDRESWDAVLGKKNENFLGDEYKDVDFDSMEDIHPNN